MKNFTPISNELFEPSQLSIQARFLMCVLLKYSGQDDSCYPSQKTLAKDLGYADARSIRNLINELIKSGLIEKHRYGFNRSNTYMVAKAFVVKRNSGSYHLGSKFPLHKGTTLPTKNTYRKAKTKKGLSILENRMKELKLMPISNIS